VECKKVFSISILHAHCNNKLILYIIIKEKGESYNLYVDPFSRKKFLSLCSIVKTTEWNGLVKIDN
jgi:hypothetical protein